VRKNLQIDVFQDFLHLKIHILSLFFIFIFSKN
jgi:hypothetical protein